MTEQPKTVSCATCSAKFHVPDELIRGKLVKFRCRKCGKSIDVDGRKGARPSATPAVEITAVDTPATFSQPTLPLPRPPAVLSSSATSLHPWPEPPRTRSTTVPTAISDVALPEESLARLEAVRDPSSRGPKIAAVVALLIAAGLSGIGLAMRNTPGASGAILVHGTSRPMLAAEPSAPLPTGDQPGALGEAKESDRPTRTATRISDLPPAVGNVHPAAAGLATTSKPVEAVIEKQEPQAPHEALPSTMPAAARSGVPAPASAREGEPDPATHPPTSGANALAAPSPASHAKGDFDTQAAREALEDAAGRAGKCKTIDTPSGTARVAVTFAANGLVTHAVIESGPFVGTAAGTCVASQFRAARVPTFTGDPVQVHKSIPF